MWICVLSPQTSLCGMTILWFMTLQRNGLCRFLGGLTAAASPTAQEPKASMSQTHPCEDSCFTTSRRVKLLFPGYPKSNGFQTSSQMLRKITSSKDQKVVRLVPTHISPTSRITSLKYILTLQVFILTEKKKKKSINKNKSQEF